MTKHIRIITTHTTDVSHKMKNLEPFARHKELKFSQVKLDKGPASIECEFDEVLASPYIIGRAMEAEQDMHDPVHAIVIDCVGDPALHAAREAVRIPVLGAGETAMHVAATLGHRFSVVTIMDRVRPILENHMKMYGVYDHCASVRAVEIPVLEINKDHQRLYKLLAEEALKAVEQDKADVIVLGCTGFVGCDKHIKDYLLENGFDVPVVDPLPTTVMVAAALLEASLTHSLKTYPRPPVKLRKGYSIPDIV
ncbi:aspartate/glutamate racemase family protein [Govanella unica]|uniref:Aspartate/glutamate racemase family protein n=1 Tax=Govanella unica TaxID=2975056 RepID=A0A9X3Z6I5_9PROT|nr:aspartate/glutamate racemase family protein [Govania unica]MDA5193245.1 aspartate/glutamate racemase family protein [Govania unica]